VTRWRSLPRARMPGAWPCATTATGFEMSGCMWDLAGLVINC